MTPTDLQDLQAVRAAAEDTETLNYCITQDGEEFVKVPPHEMMEMRNYILATIQPDAEQPVTAEWLREVWGFKYMEDDNEFYLEHNYNEYSVVMNKDGIATFYLGAVSCDAWPHDIHCRHQFTQLMTALGITPRGITTKEGKQ